LVTVKEVQEICKISAKSAGELVALFETKQILKEYTGNFRNRIFMYRAYLDLFND
jgi:hypothetical protein